MNWNRMKKSTLYVLAGTMVLTLAACGSAKNSSAENTASAETATPEIRDDSLGRWEVNHGSLSMDNSPEARAAFEKATEGLTGYEYEPIALLGTQVVAGTNYSILVRGKAAVPDAVPSYEILTVYEDLQGNAQIASDKTLLGEENEETVGAFTVNDGEYDLSKNEEVKAVFAKALEGYVGASYEDVAYLGSQVVSGTDYLAMFRETPAVPDGKQSFTLVSVYEDLEGNTEILSTEEVSLDTEEDDTAVENVKIPDPYEEYTTLEEAEKAAGFDMHVPEAPEGYANVIYRVNASEKMLEVIYSDKDPGEEDAVEAYRIRKAVGSDDISGDYNEYSETDEVSVSDNPVALKGNDGSVFVAVWTSGAYTYAIDIDHNGQGLSRDEVLTLVNAVE